MNASRLLILKNYKLRATTLHRAVLGTLRQNDLIVLAL